VRDARELRDAESLEPLGVERERRTRAACGVCDRQEIERRAGGGEQVRSGASIEHAPTMIPDSEPDGIRSARGGPGERGKWESGIGNRKKGKRMRLEVVVPIPNSRFPKRKGPGHLLASDDRVPDSEVEAPCFRNLRRSIQPKSFLLT
jgi:hypothetical protein